MAKFEIEVYKGQTIEYDDDYDKFICEISIEDKYKKSKRSSLKEVRKEIDSFIKINAEFKPFKALFKSEYGEKDFSVHTVEAIRTDGKFVVSGGYSKSHYGKNEMERCMIYDADIVQEKDKLEKQIKKLQDELRDKIIALSKRLVKADLSKYDKFISQSAENR